jgi:hypothetical protein
MASSHERKINVNVGTSRDQNDLVTFSFSSSDVSNFGLVRAVFSFIENDVCVDQTERHVIFPSDSNKSFKVQAFRMPKVNEFILLYLIFDDKTYIAVEFQPTAGGELSRRTLN